MELPPSIMDREDVNRLCNETNIIISMSVSTNVVDFMIFVLSHLQSQRADTARSINDILSIHKEIVSASFG